MKGWVAKKITLSGCNPKEERVKFAKEIGVKTPIADEFSGSGKPYLSALPPEKGQTLTLNHRRPTALSYYAPNGRKHL
jgi:hypothetical protein